MPPDIEVTSPAEEFVSICIRCDNESHGEPHNAQTTEGEPLCAYCADTRYRQCRNCADYVDRSDAVHPADDRSYYSPRYYCEDCAHRVLNMCGSCESYVHQLGDDDENCASCQPLCFDCDYYLSDCVCGENLIHDYSWTPEELKFHGEGPAYLGLELEVTTHRGQGDAAQVAYDALGELGYLKSDSSVNGFECVTHPMSHAYARESFPWKMLDDLETLGCSGNDAGIHVHVSRAGFASPSHIYRWMKLIYRNPRAVRAIARRHSDDWAAFDSHHRRNHKHYAKGSRSAARYSAINVQNRATFEVRVFASSMKRQEVQAALDLVAASVEYTRDLTVPQILDGGWTWDGFMAWARDRPEYSALVEQSNALV